MTMKQVGPMRRSMRPQGASAQDVWEPRHATTNPFLPCLCTSRLGSAIVAMDPAGHSERVRSGADTAIMARKREQSVLVPNPDSG